MPRHFNASLKPELPIARRLPWRARRRHFEPMRPVPLPDNIASASARVPTRVTKLRLFFSVAAAMVVFAAMLGAKWRPAGKPSLGNSDSADNRAPFAIRGAWRDIGRLSREADRVDRPSSADLLESLPRAAGEADTPIRADEIPPTVAAATAASVSVPQSVVSTADHPIAAPADVNRDTAVELLTELAVSAATSVPGTPHERAIESAAPNATAQPAPASIESLIEASAPAVTDAESSPPTAAPTVATLTEPPLPIRKPERLARKSRTTDEPTRPAKKAVAATAPTKSDAAVFKDVDYAAP